MQKFKGKTQMAKMWSDFFEDNKLGFHTQWHNLVGARKGVSQKALRLSPFLSSMRVIMIPHTVLQKKT